MPAVAPVESTLGVPEEEIGFIDLCDPDIVMLLPLPGGRSTALDALSQEETRPKEGEERPRPQLMLIDDDFDDRTDPLAIRVPDEDVEEFLAGTDWQDYLVDDLLD